MVEGGAVVGTVRAIIPAGATEVLEIDRGPGEYTLLVPFTRAVVPEIDIKAGWLSIYPPGETEEERDTVSDDEVSDDERPNEAENEAEEDNGKKD
jgi:16S rRNA processing protein RimM